MRFNAEPVYAVLIMGFVWASLFGRWLPAPVQSVLFLVVLFIEAAILALSWWRWIKGRNAADTAKWRIRVALVGAVANTAAIATPVGSLLYMIYYPFPKLRLHLPMVDGEKMVLICLALSVCGLIAGIFSPSRSRFVTITGGLILALIVLAIPMGVL